MKSERILNTLGYIGVMFMTYGFLSLILIVFSYFFGELDLMKPVLPSSLFFIASGSALFLWLRKRFTAELSMSSAMRIAAIMWFVLPLLSTIPFLVAGDLDFVSALFEAMSGYTTTGLTMYADVESLPDSILFWRSFMQWIGGIGILALFITIFSSRTPVLRRLYTAEGRSDTVNFDVVRTSRTLWLFYFVVTALCFLLLWNAGMPLFDSLNHAFTSLSTGGFSVKNSSIGYYNNLWIEIILMIFMIVGATNFVYMINLIKSIPKRKKPALNVELEGFLIILFIAIAFIVFVGKMDLRGASFQAISATATTGFQTRNLNSWSDFNKVMLSLLMIVGGSSGSTAGAVKIFRVEIFFLSLYWYFRRLALPKDAVIVQRFGGKKVQNEEVVHVVQYIMIYVLSLLAGAMVLTAYGNPFVNSFFEAASAIGNTGLSVGITSAGMPTVEKIVLTIEMWIGRVEIFPVLMLFFRARTG
ncbi:MAG: TrkH family potassium uptake protein [Candidatus Thermoplasmatota archaeon]|nr:TrkH family potassium uptake protein [Candidatus Thermoplasmatota archaeon]